MTEKAKICILGGGFGGLYAALRLSELPWNPPETPEIVLIDNNDRFLFSPLLYELLTGELQSWEIAPPFSELLANTRVRFHQGTVSDINLENRQVHLEDGMEFTYDRAILALGGETPLDLVPGCADYAFPFRTIADAYRLEERLRLLEASDKDKIRIAVVGGGYSGVELACKLADRLQNRGRLRLVEKGTEILQTSTEFNREAALKALEERGIWIDLETTTEEITPDTISLLYRGQVDPIPVDLVIWTVGTQVASVVKSLPVKHTERGQIEVTRTLQAINHPELLAIGDLAYSLDANGQPVPTTAQSAMQQADYAAWNIWASLSDRPLLPFEYQGLGEMMTLGIDNATLTGLGVKLDGQMAHLLRRLAYLYRMPTFDHQLKVGLNWITQPVREFFSQSGLPR
ncbi:NAD(P)/FAD-dependent oxidoreductase [Phormidium pseudopriestleyi FRX01]|uniref:NAD(P)/FAD-dependent oxidoreductase n=1 Tax=Phormidium pseudopriestleyi FRX01 TaxID=1759528 RepID=A0ABS3FNZ4_9CYAN|nr:NAD(P)/FAD-dependent oxidoreductase [Phormidium pseudopriestleyi]MBO0348602.1 NAD(P)/FAD-dependent oxidoreductase [Phormidium pseudopriestleyi FRX01]